MKLTYVPLLGVQREIYDVPRGMDRFHAYLRTITNDGNDVDLPPLVIVNPMAKEPVTAVLDELIALGADTVGAEAAAEAAAELTDISSELKASLVLADDVGGAWSNRSDYEFVLRFGAERLRDRPTKRAWITGVLWSSEPASAEAARRAMLTAAYRTAYVLDHGPVRTLRDMLAQEGWVLAKAGATGPVLDPEDIEYTREVISSALDARDKRTAIEHLFGDEAARSLGFTPRGLSRWAGLALARHDAVRDGAAARTP